MRSRTSERERGREENQRSERETERTRENECARGKRSEREGTQGYTLHMSSVALVPPVTHPSTLTTLSVLNASGYTPTPATSPTLNTLTSHTKRSWSCALQSLHRYSSPTSASQATAPSLSPHTLRSRLHPSYLTSATPLRSSQPNGGENE